MASPLQQIVELQLPAAASLLYLSPVGVWTQITKLTCTNVDTSSHAVTFYIVPQSGTSATSNAVTFGKAILAKDTWNSPNEYGLVINPSCSLWGFADTASVVNAFVAGLLSS